MPLTCKCNNCCENVLRTTSVTTTGSVVFVTDSTITPKNDCKYILKIPCSLIPRTAVTTITQVFVRVNNINIPLQCVLGNNVFSDQIRCFNVDNCGNIILRLAYGSTPAHFKILNQKLCCSLAYGATATVAETPDTATTQNAKANTATPKA